MFCAAQDVIRTNVLIKFHEKMLNKTRTIFKLIQNIIKTKILTKFHAHWTINVTFRVFTSENAPTPNFIGKNLLTKFQDDRSINVASRVLTRFYYSHIEKNAPPPGGHVFQQNKNIFELIQHIIRTNLLTKLLDDWTINVPSRELTRKNALPPGGHVFQPNGTILELVKDMFSKNLLTKFHVNQTINVATIVLTRQMLMPHNAGRTKSNHKSSP
ncbi:hypothetical protein DPMN_093781 [Dreissena polymorpha]|uniref:Uncharacterized protein n=1 Tax=Dreissena polymorpha TaxID=45954 RepID=A0A9D4L470_DREPO|nr:hypothetical protein DPMN_093781 [Dreissena polymorpha]